MVIQFSTLSSSSSTVASPHRPSVNTETHERCDLCHLSRDNDMTSHALNTVSRNLIMINAHVRNCF